MLYFTKPKDLNLNKFNINFTFNPIENGYEFVLKSNILIKNLYLYMPFQGKWSENFFDLVPGKEKRILFLTDEKIKNIASQIEFKSLNHVLKP